MDQAQAARHRADRVQRCRSLAVKADEHAAQAADPQMRATFLSMKDLWLKLANEIDRGRGVV